ncbi:MAG: HAMP domain-containing protein [Hyphomicrobium sp.]|nr:HAMP domain-containing protein [Hyphomicrobium sp.]
MRISLRLGLILAIAAILLSTLSVSAVLTYWHAMHKVEVELQSTLSAAQRTIRVALQDIEGSPSESRQVGRLVRTFDASRHVRVELKASDGTTLQSSTPAPVQSGMPSWFYRALAPRELTARVDWPSGTRLQQHILVTADPRNEAGEVWSDVRLHLTTILLFCLLTLAILSALLGYALSPFARFLEAFERTGHGAVGEQLPVSGPLELQSLATGFNRMSALLADTQEKNRKLDAQLEAVQEEERASLARDLHDEVGPLLFSIDVDATTIRDLAEKKSEPKFTERALSIQDAVSQVKEQVRSILWQLRPGLVLDLGLANALENMLAPLKARHPHVQFTLDAPRKTSQPQIDIALLAIVREAVLNALKHGKPKHIAIRIGPLTGETIEAVVSNDGGARTTALNAGSLGVISMQERTKLLGGHLSIVDNREKTGVEVRVSIPLKGPGGGAAPVAPSTQTLQ